MPEAYAPSPEYNAAYDALQRRLRANFAGQRAGLQQELATRGVNTSGVASIPLARLGAAEEGAVNDNTQAFALEQARTGVEDRRRREDYANEREMLTYRSGLQEALQRRLAESQLQAQLIGGAIGAGGSLLRPGRTG